MICIFAFVLGRMCICTIGVIRVRLLILFYMLDWYCFVWCKSLLIPCFAGCSVDKKRYALRLALARTCACV